VAIEPKKSWQILYNLPRRQAGLPAEARSAEATNAEHTIWLPLINAFMNREIEFGFTFQNIQTVFEGFKIAPSLAYSVND